MKFLGWIFVIILAVVGIFCAVFIPKALKLNKEATTYVEDAIPKITAQWNDQELINRATPQLLASIKKSPTEIDRLFLMFRKLGTLKKLDTPKGSAGVQSFTGKGTVTYGNYIVHAQFERGPATIRVQVLREDDGWKINEFRIDSNIFLK